MHSYFSLQMDEASDGDKDRLLITYSRFIDGNGMREESLLCWRGGGLSVWLENEWKVDVENQKSF